MRQSILARQEEQRDKEHQGRKENEEITGNILIKIDELQKQYNVTKQDLQSILSQERKIIKKRMQSKYILKYIDFFDKFREIFLGEHVKEDKIKRLYDAQDIASLNEIKHFDEIIKENNIDADARSNYSANSSFNTPRSYGEFSNGSRTPSSPFKSNKDFIKEADQRAEDNQSQSDQEIERTELISKINNFLDLYPTGLDVCVESVLRLLNKMRYQQETNNDKYEQLLKAKTQKTHDLIVLEEDFYVLKMNNPYVETMRQNKAEEARIEGIQEAFDAGYAKVNQARYPLVATGNHGEELAQKLSHFTTVNIMKQIDHTDFKHIVNEIRINKNFFFNFFMNYGDSIIRICKIVKTIFKKILQNTPSPVMNKKCSECIKYINSLWSDNEKNKEVVDTNQSDYTETKQTTQESKPINPNQLGLPQIPNRHRSRVSIDNIGLEQLEFLQHQQEKAQKKQKKRKIIVEKFNSEEIRNLFLTIFGEGFDEQAAQFFQELKDDRLVWFFCNIDTIQEYLIQKFSQNEENSDLAVEDALVSFVSLEDQASQEYNHKLNNLYNHFTGLMNQIKLENKEILDDLQQKNIIYRPHRIYKQNEVLINPKINQAIENAIKRQNEYLFSLSDNIGGKDDLSMYGNGPGSPTSTHLHHNLLNNKNKSKDEINSGVGQKDSSRLQQIIDFISNVPSSRQREAAKRKYIPTPSNYIVNSKLQNQSGIVYGNISNQNIAITVNPTINRGSTVGSKDLVPLQLISQNSMNQAEKLQQLQLGSSQSHQNHQILLQQHSQQINSPMNSPVNSMYNAPQFTISTVLNTQSTAQGNSEQQQRLPGLAGGILKKKTQKKNTQDFKSMQDIFEDQFIDEEAKKQKDREKQIYLEHLMKEKEKNKKLLQIEKEKEPNAQFKVIQNLNKRLTQASDSQSNHKKVLKQFSINQTILSKIDRLDRNFDPSSTTTRIFSDINQEKKNIYKTMVQQEQDERLGSEDEKNKHQVDEYDDEDEDYDNVGSKKSNSLQKSQSAYSYLKTTNATEQRKKAAIETIRELESERMKNYYNRHDNPLNNDKNSSLPQSQNDKLRDKGKSSENNRQTNRSWKTSVSTAANSKRPDTQQFSSATNINNQFFSSQNQKFFQKYQNDDNRMPDIREKGKTKSLEKRIPHSSKSSSDIKNLKFQPLTYRESSQNKKQSQGQQYKQKNAPQTSDAKFTTELKTSDYDRVNFYDFPFFSHPMSVQNNQYNIPMYPLLNPPNLNLYTPTGLLTNYSKNDNMNIQSSQSYY